MQLLTQVSTHKTNKFFQQHNNLYLQKEILLATNSNSKTK